MKFSPLVARIEEAPWSAATLCFSLLALVRVVHAQLVPISYVSDEATWIAASRWFWLIGEPRTHAGRLPVLLPALFSPLFGVLDFERAYSVAKTLNSRIATAAIFPIWRIARAAGGSTHLR